MQKEIQELQGKWRFTSLEVEGSALPEEAFRSSSMLIQGGTFEMKSAEATYMGTFRVDATALPKTIDLFFTGGPEEGKMSLGIYEVDGDAWTICLGLAGRSRPTEFATKPHGGHALETLVRERH